MRGAGTLEETLEARPTSRASTGGRPRSPAVDRALIAATLAILAEEGYARLSMAGVAKRAGVSGTTLYRRWPSKEDLVGAALASLAPSLSCPDTGTLAGDLTALLTDMGGALRSDSGALLVGVISETLRNPDLGRLARDRLCAPGTSLMATIMARAAARGEIPPQDADLARNLVAGAALHRHLIDGRPPTPAFIADLVPMIVAALRVPSAD